jgi:hypothetical protein
MIATETVDERGPVPAPLSTTSSMTLIGTLIWIGPLMAFVLIGNAVMLAVLARVGDPDESIWTYIGASWQRWPIGAAGFTIAIAFLPMLVTNGVTRTRLAQSATVTMVALAALGAAVVTLGYAIEGRVFDAEGWSHVMSADAGWIVADVGYTTIFASFGLVNAVYFASGWLAATALRRFGWWWFIPFLLVALVPIAAVEYLMMNPFGTAQTELLERLGRPSLWVGIPVSIGVVAATAAVAGRLSRSVAVD